MKTKHLIFVVMALFLVSCVSTQSASNKKGKINNPAVLQGDVYEFAKESYTVFHHFLYGTNPMFEVNKPKEQRSNKKMSAYAAERNRAKGKKHRGIYEQFPVLPAEPVIIIDGYNVFKEHKDKLKEIKKEDIESIEVTHSAANTAVFGSRAIVCVVYIKLKESAKYKLEGLKK